MPHGNNSKKRVNAKKKGQKDRRAPLSAVNDARTAKDGRNVEATTAKAQELPRSKFSTLHPFPHNDDGKKSHPLFDTTKESIYVRYKNSTLHFKDALQAMVPREIFQSDSVSALVEATDYVVKENLEVDNSLLNDLKFTIRVRKRMALEKYAGGDDGHSHFIEVLEYCWSLLAPRRKRKQPVVVSSTSEESTEPSLSNRFEKLSTEDGTHDDEDDEDDLPQTPQRRPTTSGPTRLTLQELIDGTDRADIELFLMTLDELMGFIATHYSDLKEASIQVRQQHLPASAIVQQMMEASVAANLAIEQVAALEEAFVRDHPHLNTVYRVLAQLVLAREICDLTCIVTEKSPMASQFSVKLAVEFLGDAMECAYRCPKDEHNKKNCLVTDFLSRWQFRDDTPMTVVTPVPMTVQRVFDDIQIMARVEAPLKAEGDDRLVSALAASGLRSHSWLPAKYIGSSRSITHTIHLLQSFSSFTKFCYGEVSFPEGFYGVRWRGRTKPAKRIQQEMDDLLFAVILPSLAFLCREGILSIDLPYKEELLIGFVQIKALMDHPERPVSWALAFTVHAILTSIFEVQGSDHLTFLAQTARDAFEKYFEQVKSAEEQRQAANLHCSPSWPRNVDAQLSIQLLVQLPPQKVRTREQALLPIWNPFCAGAFLSYIAYYGNLHGGTMLVDTVYQLRVTLHLFNALKQVGMIKPGHIKLLDRIFKMFEGCNAIWDGPLPTKGQLQTRWMMTFGGKGGEARLRRLKGHSSSQIMSKFLRSTTPFTVDRISKSFRQICLRDPCGVVDTRNGIGQRRKKMDTLYKLGVRANGTLRGMSEEEQLLAINFTSLGFLSNQFFNKLFADLGAMPSIETIAGHAFREFKTDCVDYFKYQTMIAVFSRDILGPMDAGETAVTSECAKIMASFFSGISLDDVFWFLPKSLSEPMTANCK